MHYFFLLLFFFSFLHSKEKIQKIISDYWTNSIYQKKGKLKDFSFNGSEIFNKVIQGTPYISINFNNLEEVNQKLKIKNITFKERGFNKMAFFHLNSQLIYFKDDFFVNSNDKNSFSVVFSFHPLEHFEENIIFEKKNSVYQRDKVIQQRIKFFFDSTGFFFCLFENIFQFQGKYKTILLQSKQKISLHSWYFLQLYYSSLKGEIGFFLNGKKQQVKMVSLTGDINSPICQPFFFEKKLLNSSFFVFGSKYIGYLENIIFIKEVIDKNIFLKKN